MSYIIAGYHLCLESGQGGQKKDTIYKYIYVSDDWVSIMKFYKEGLIHCANYFFYYLVTLDKPFDLKHPTHTFNVKNAHQMPKSLATHHFNELIDNLNQPVGLNPKENTPTHELHYFYNQETQMAVLSKQTSNDFLSKYDEQKQAIHVETTENLRKALL